MATGQGQEPPVSLGQPDASCELPGPNRRRLGRICRLGRRERRYDEKLAPGDRFAGSPTGRAVEHRNRTVLAGGVLRRGWPAGRAVRPQDRRATTSAVSLGCCMLAHGAASGAVPSTGRATPAPSRAISSGSAMSSSATILPMSMADANAGHDQRTHRVGAHQRSPGRSGPSGLGRRASGRQLSPGQSRPDFPPDAPELPVAVACAPDPVTIRCASARCARLRGRAGQSRSALSPSTRRRRDAVRRCRGPTAG